MVVSELTGNEMYGELDDYSIAKLTKAEELVGSFSIFAELEFESDQADIEFARLKRMEVITVSLLADIVGTRDALIIQKFTGYKMRRFNYGLRVACCESEESFAPFLFAYLMDASCEEVSQLYKIAPSKAEAKIVAAREQSVDTIELLLTIKPVSAGKIAISGLNRQVPKSVLKYKEPEDTISPRDLSPPILDSLHYHE